MKKTFGVLLALLLVVVMLPLYACAESLWQVQEYVDDFGDSTGEKYVIGGPFIGTFNNSATTKSEVKVYVFSDGGNISIRLYEYGDQLVNNPYSETEEYDVKVKATIAEGREEIFCFKGYVFSGEADIYVDNQLYADEYKGELSAKEIMNIRFENLNDVLSESSVLKFSIQSTSSPLNKYTFVIDNMEGFNDAVQSINGISAGMRVVHPEFGEGTVESFEYRDDMTAYGVPAAWYVEIQYDNGENSGLLYYPDIFESQGIEIID